MKFTYLEERGIIKLSGSDTKKLLQNITTKDITKLSQDNTMYCLILSPNGRYVHDFFLIEKDHSIFLECNKHDTKELIGKLTLYRLQSKVQIEDFSQHYKVGVFFEKELDTKEFILNKITTEIQNNQKIILYNDPRSSVLGVRTIIPKSIELQILETSNYNEYEALRIKNTVPDSFKDMKKNISFPLHYRIDTLNGIDFNKGCYIGQEVVARMKLSGIKKQIYTIESNSEINMSMLNNEDNVHVTSNNQEIGIFLSGIKNIGLCLFNIDQLNEALKNNSEIYINNTPIKVILQNSQIDEYS